MADWAGVAQREFPWHKVHHRLLPRREGPRADRPARISRSRRPTTHLPPRFLGNWDQPLLAYADRDRIIPPEVQPLKLTLSGDCTVTVDGRVAASWRMDGPKLLIKPHTDFDHDAVRDEALRTARFCGGDEVELRVNHLRAAKDEIDRRYAEPLDIATLASTALASEAHFIRSFKREFGETPHRYLQRRRIERAGDRLRETDDPITQIALDVGFTCISWFATAFREVMGETPTAYRDRHRGAPPRDDPRLLHDDVDPEEQFSASRSAAARLASGA